MLKMDITPSTQTVSYWDDAAPGFTATVQQASSDWRINIQSSGLALPMSIPRYNNILVAAAEAATYLNTYGWSKFQADA